MRECPVTTKAAGTFVVWCVMTIENNLKLNPEQRVVSLFTTFEGADKEAQKLFTEHHDEVYGSLDSFSKGSDKYNNRAHFDRYDNFHYATPRWFLMAMMVHND